MDTPTKIIENKNFLRQQAVIKKQRKELIYLRNIIQNLPISIYWKNKNGVYLGCNESMRIFTGSNEIIGKKDSELPWKEHASHLNAIEQRVMRSGESVSLEERFILKNGEKINLLTQKIPLYDENGVISGILGISVDISKFKKLESQLKKSKNEAEFILNNIVANMPGHVYWKNKKGIYLGCNNLQAQNLGLTRGEEVIGKTDLDLPWSKESAEIFRKNDRRIMEHGRSNVFEEKIKINGQEATVLSHKTPLRNKKGKIVGILGISIDISKLKAREKVLKKAKELAESANQAKSKFIANMSHDIRTPMNGVIGIADILKREGSTERDREYGEIIYSSGQRLLQLLNDILDLIQSNDISEKNIHQDIIDLPLLLRNLKQLILPNVQTKNINFILDIDPSLPIFIISDRIKLDRILLNIISNAIKFTQQGSIILAVKKIFQDSSDLIIQFKITDTGIGIPQNEINKIFDLFYRAIPSYEGTYEGHGIGLFIARKSIEILKGKIEVSSKVKQGTTFTIELPVKVDESSHLLSTNPESQLSNPSQMTSNNIFVSEIINPKKESLIRKVLLIEDDPLAQRTGKFYLEAIGFDVEMASSAEIAIKMVKSFPFDLIISDIGLPGLTGNEFTVLIRYWEKITNRKPIPIVGLSAHSSSQIKEESLAAGMNFVLTKPLNDQKLEEITLILGRAKHNESNNLKKDLSTN